MRILKIESAAGKIEVMDVEDELHVFQDLVGGYIECGAPAELRARGIELICNEEGLLKQLKANVNLFPFFYVGTCVLVGYDHDGFTSLTDEQLKYANEWLLGLTK